MSANGFSSRCLRARSRATARRVAGAAGQVVAAEALDGHDRPGAQQRRAPPRRRPRRLRGAAAPTSRARGPQSGQAFGWAWKRRSAGSSYSRRHAAHIANAAIVVSGRS